MLMMFRVRNPIVACANPYMMSDPAWGFTYVLHGLAGVGFVGLIIAHIYFALRPEKLWITKSMIFGYITRAAVPRAPRSRALEDARRRRHSPPARMPPEGAAPPSARLPSRPRWRADLAARASTPSKPATS